MCPMSDNTDVRAAFVKAVEDSGIDEAVEDGKFHPLCRTLRLWTDANEFANTAYLTKVTIQNWVTFASVAHTEGAERSKWLQRGVTLLRCFGQVFDGDEAGALGRDIVEMNLHCIDSDIREAAVLTLEIWCENDEDGVWLSMLAAHRKRESSVSLKDYCTQVLDDYEWGVGEPEQLKLPLKGERNKCDPSNDDLFDALYALYLKGSLTMDSILEILDVKPEPFKKLLAPTIQEPEGSFTCPSHAADFLPAPISSEEHQKFLDVAEKYRENVITGHISTERVPKFLQDNLGIHPHLALDLIESHKIEKVSTRVTSINILVGRMYPSASQVILFAWTPTWAFSMTTHEKFDWLIGIFS